jgi:hypothetical protein
MYVFFPIQKFEGLMPGPDEIKRAVFSSLFSTMALVERVVLKLTLAIFFTSNPEVTSRRAVITVSSRLFLSVLTLNFEIIPLCSSIRTASV